MSGVTGRLGGRKLVVVALALQLALLAWVAYPRLSPRLFGREYLIVAHAVDPVDPFRGRYVDLRYDLGVGYTDLRGPVWVSLRHGRKLWRLGAVTRERPHGTPAMRCESSSSEVRCGIESFFASEANARALAQALVDRGALARVRIDTAGRAAIIGLTPR